MPVGERQLLEQVELTSQERQLCVHAAEGRLLDLRCACTAEEDPADGGRWSSARQVRAQVLLQLLTGQGPELASHVVAVRLRGAAIVGRLNLGGLTLRCPLELYDCHLGGRLDLAKATAPNLSLRGTYLCRGLSARRLSVTHSLNLTGRFHSTRRVDLRSAYVGGDLDCSRATLTNEGGEALVADRLAVDGSLFLTDSRVTGQVRLSGAHIGGQLNCSRATLTNEGGEALVAVGLAVDGNLFLTNSQVTGLVRLPAAQIKGVLVCSRATLTNEGGEALVADVLAVDAGLYLADATVTGKVRLSGAHIGDVLDCSRATLTNEGGEALVADRLAVDAGLYLADATVTGKVRLSGAHIGDVLDCSRATLTNEGGEALVAVRLAVDGNLFLTDSQVTGLVRLPAAQIKGVLVCSTATLTNEGGEALIADVLAADAGLYLADATVTGKVRLSGAHIGDVLDCSRATLTNEGGEALVADRLAVDGNLMLADARVTGLVLLPAAQIKGVLDCSRGTLTNEGREALVAVGLAADNLVLYGATVTGLVRLSGAHVRGELNCLHAALRNPGGLAVELQRISVAQAVQMRPASLQGGIDLTHARAGGWFDERRTWPTRLWLEGFVYEAIYAPDVTVKDRLAWLRRHQDGYIPQPYEQLAEVYRREGNEQAARTVAIAKQWARRADVAGWRRLPGQVWSWFLRWTIGYGYQPALALIPLLVLFVAGWAVFDAAHPERLAPAKAGDSQVSFNPARYTLDLLLPVVNFRQRDAFVPTGWVAWASFGFTFAGWLLAAVVVAGLTGVFKRE